MARTHTEPESLQRPNPERGTGRVVYFGYLRNKECILLEEKRWDVTPSDIMYALSRIGDGERGFTLPKIAGRRKGWSYHRVEYWWQSDQDGIDYQQWSLTVC